MTDEPYIASDEHQVRSKKADARRERMNDKSDLRVVLSTQEGRRFLWKLLEETGIYRTSFTGNSTTFFNEGQRNVGLKLLNSIMDADPAAYTTMVQENRSNG